MTTPTKTSPKKGALKMSAAEMNEMATKRKGKKSAPVNVADLMEKC